MISPRSGYENRSLPDAARMSVGRDKEMQTAFSSLVRRTMRNRVPSGGDKGSKVFYFLSKYIHACFRAIRKGGKSRLEQRAVMGQGWGVMRP